MTEDVGDLEAALLAASQPPRGRCKVCDWLEGRDDADQWDRAFRNPNIQGAQITRFMRDRGYGYKNDTVLTHRREQHRVG